MKPFNTDLVSYWEKLKAGRTLPSEDDLDPDTLGAMWYDCFLMQFRDIDNVVDYNYSYLGEGIIGLYSEGGINVSLPGVVTLDALNLEKQFSDVRASQDPLMYEGERALPCGRRFAYRQCLLPLSYDGESVHSILGRLQYQLGDERDDELAS